VQPEGLGNLIKIIHLIGSRTRDLQVCNRREYLKSYNIPLSQLTDIWKYRSSGEVFYAGITLQTFKGQMNESVTEFGRNSKHTVNEHGATVEAADTDRAFNQKRTHTNSDTLF
jgi:hypothetical protein